MTAPFTHTYLPDLENGAAQFGLEGQTAHFATEPLGNEHTGCTLQRFEPDAHPGFGHRHFDAEEVYFVARGSGRIKLDDEIIEVRAMDAVRVEPQVWRAFSAGPDGMDIIAFGPQHPGDGDAAVDWWPR